MQPVYKSPEGGLYRQLADFQDARQDRIAGNEPQLIRVWLF